MATKQNKSEETVSKLPQVDVLVAQGKSDKSLHYDQGRVNRRVLAVRTTFPTCPDKLFRHSLHKWVHHTLARL